MLNLETQILSTETIKPSSPETHKKNPFKLCLFDQLTPSTYVSCIWFYSSCNGDEDMILSHIKTTLSKALNILYPFSGRVKNNIFIHDFHQGVPFSSARINCKLSDFLKLHKIEWLNKLLPFQTFRKESNIEQLPLMAWRATIFACGGIALGLCISHKIADGKTGWIIVDVWGKVARDCHVHSIVESSDHASLIFPPKNPMPENYISMMEKLWFTDANFVTRRFTFSAPAITELKSSIARATRTEMVSGLIWKCSMSASRRVYGTPKPSIVVQAINMRPRQKNNPLTNAIGNVFWWASALANPAETSIGLPELVELMRDSIASFDEEYLSTMEGEKGFDVVAEYLNQLEMMFSFESPDIFAFSSWLNLGINKMDLGWGPPCSFAMFGKVGPAFRNLTLLVETVDGNGIDAWITMDEKRMSVLEKDGEFLKFASPHGMISSL